MAYNEVELECGRDDEVAEGQLRSPVADVLGADDELGDAPVGMVRGGIVTDLPRGRLLKIRPSPEPVIPPPASGMLPLATGPMEVACICCKRECHIICTVLVRSSLLENAHRISCMA